SATPSRWRVPRPPRRRATVRRGGQGRSRRGRPTRARAPARSPRTPSTQSRSPSAERPRRRFPGGSRQSLLQPQRIPDGKHFPVVVEVREDLNVTAPLLEAPRPLFQLRLAVVSAPAARA